MRRLVVSALVLAATLTASGGIARADHEGSYAHNDDGQITNRMHAPTLSASQMADVQEAAVVWSLEANDALQFTKGTTFTSGDPHNLWDDSGVRLIWEGTCPPTGMTGCSGTMASVNVVGITYVQAPNGSGHYPDVDTIFKEAIAWATTDNTAECYGQAGDRTPGAGDNEPGVMAPGDVGPFKGDKDDDGTFDADERDSYPGDYDNWADQFSWAFHEFVHWQHLFDANSTVTTKYVSNGAYQECWSDAGASRTAEAVRDIHDLPAVEAIYAHSH